MSAYDNYLERRGVFAPKPGAKAMVSIPIDPVKAAEHARGPKTFGEAVRLLRVAALTGSPKERRNAQKALEALDGHTTTKEATMSKKAYESPFGNIPDKKKSESDDGGKSAIRDLIKVISKSANDPNDPKSEQAKKLLQLLTDFCDDDGDKASGGDVEDKTRPKGVPPAARAKALRSSGPTRLSPYADMLDEQMGLTTQRGVRVEGTQLILSSAHTKRER